MSDVTRVLDAIEQGDPQTGGGPPFRIQRATDLIAADWTEFLPDATPPVILSVTGPCGFYRIVGQ